MAELREIPIPDHITGIPQYQKIDAILENMMSDLMDEIENLKSDIEIMTGTEYGTARRERILGIKPLASDSLDERRQRVLLAWYDIYPYTWLDLVRRIRNVTGSGTVISYDPEDMAISATLDTFSGDTAIQIYDLMENITPLMIILNVVVIVNPEPVQVTHYAGCRECISETDTVSL